MLTANSTYEEIKHTMDSVERVLIRAVPRSKGLAGKRQRALLKGQASVWHRFVVGEQEVMVWVFVRSKTWMFFIPVYDGEGYVAFYNRGKDRNRMLTLMRRHAVDRYVQRYEKHDENADVSDEEYGAAVCHILESMPVCTAVYDRATNASLINIDGGALLCNVINEKHLILIQTYITVSMMKSNQSIANGVAMRESRAMMREFTVEDQRARAIGNLFNDYAKLCRR